jgi:hypothetical protein
VTCPVIAPQAALKHRTLKGFIVEAAPLLICVGGYHVLVKGEWDEELIYALLAGVGGQQFTRLAGWVRF